MKRIIFFVILLTSCEKKEEDSILYDFTYQTDYRLYFNSSQNFEKVEEYKNGNLINLYTYEYINGMIIKHHFDSAGVNTNETYYLLNSDNLVYLIASDTNYTSFIDSVYLSFGTTVNTYNQDQYLIKSSAIYTYYSFTDSIAEPDSVSETFEYEVSNGNTIRTSYSHDNLSFTCYDNLDYSNTINKIDLTRFIGDFMGKKDNYLISSSVRGGCPCGPSSVPDKHHFEYVLDENGYVISKKNYRDPCHHMSVKDYSGTYSITTYEYHF